jgi:hypothetical protein
MTDEKSTHGGARPGAGRPAYLDRPKRKLVTFEGEDLETIARYCEENGLSGISVPIRHILKKVRKELGLA